MKRCIVLLASLLAPALYHAHLARSAAAPAVEPIVVDFDELDPGPLEVPYKADILSFEDSILVVSEPSRAGNSIVAASCSDDVGPCPLTITIRLLRPMAEVSLWVATQDRGVDTAFVEAFGGEKLLDVDKSVPTDFERLSVTGPGIDRIIVSVAEDPDRAVFVDDLALLPEVAAFEVDPQTIDFGAVAPGGQAVQTVTITNTGTVELSLEFSGLPRAVGVGGTCAASLPVADSCKLELTLDTEQATTIDALLRIDDVSGETRRVSVAGSVSIPTTEPSSSSEPATTTATTPTTSEPATTTRETTSETIVATTLATTAPEGRDDIDWRVLVAVGLGVLVIGAAIAVVKSRRSREPDRQRQRPTVPVRVIDGGTQVASLGEEPTALSFHLESEAAVVTPLAKEKR